MSNDRLVKLHLVLPMSVEPTPDKSIFGRFDRVLRSVGAPREVMVRPRMITAVAQTKFRTTSGLPVSVVGLHGKDELLVVGPAWALQELANGRSTDDLKPVPSEFDVLEDVKQHTLEEIFWLLRIPQLLEICRSTKSATAPTAEPAALLTSIGEGDDLAFLRDPEWAVLERELPEADSLDRELAMEYLRGFFWCSQEVFLDYFKKTDVGQFVVTYLKEAAGHYDLTVERLAAADDPHPAWWLSWDTMGETPLPEHQSSFLTASGRNVCRYPVANDGRMSAPTPRRYSMHRRWRTLVSRRRAEAEGNGASD